TLTPRSRSLHSMAASRFACALAHRPEQAVRVNRCSAARMIFEMQMRPGGVAGRADAADDGTGGNMPRRLVCGKMRVIQVVSIRGKKMNSQPAQDTHRMGDSPVDGRYERASGGTTEINSFVSSSAGPGRPEIV